MLDVCAPSRTRRVWRDDLTGRQFGSWLVVAFSHRNARGELYWDCHCQCGARQPVRANVLRSGKSTSCGCQIIYTQTTWDVWNLMLERCLNPDWPEFHRYGGRGILVSPRWQAQFENFLADMGERPEGMTLGRDNPNGHYVVGNCRWMTARELRSIRRAA
jgi:hypothetical protein